MTAVGFAAALGVDLDLAADDGEGCMLDECDKQALMIGVISTPCACPQLLCLGHYEREKPHWSPGKPIHCYLCPKTATNGGVFVEWRKA